MRGEPERPRRHDLEQPGRGEERVVEPKIVPAEEHVPAHLAGEWGPQLPHFGLDERMARLPHDRLRTGRFQGLREEFRAFDVEDYRSPGAEPPHRVPTEDHEQLVPEDYIAVLVHRPDPVGVAVESDAELRTGAAHRGLQITKVLWYGGVGMVVRKGAVGFAEERRHL